MKKPAPKPLSEPTQPLPPRDRIALERLVFFSDAVFAIAITILVLDIHVPPGTDAANSRTLFLLLARQFQQYFAFFISFWVIGFTWVSHHRKFLHIQRVDNFLLLLNLLPLMTVAFIPFPTAVMSENTSFTASTFYATTMIIASLSGLLLWQYATHNLRLSWAGPGLLVCRFSSRVLVAKKSRLTTRVAV